MSWTALLKRTVYVDDVLNLAAQQASYFFFALFPALLTLISFTSFFPVANLMDEVVALLAQPTYEERRARGETPVGPFPDNVNCDLDRGRPRRENGVRPSDLLIGPAALIPAAVRIARQLRKKNEAA